MLELPAAFAGAGFVATGGGFRVPDGGYFVVVIVVVESDEL